MGDKTKIDWCDASWNPVTGCLHGCEYCYARKIATRFCTNEHGKDEAGVVYPCNGDCAFCSELDGFEFVGQKTRWNHSRKEIYPYGFLPTFHPHRLDIPKRWTRPRTIFVCSMADLFGKWVPDEWIEKAFDACRKAPQHRYLFLTKNPDRYKDLEQKGLLINNDLYWYGYSATNNNDIWRFTHADDCPCQNLFVSIEPILKPVNPGFCSHVPADWVIIGAETGNRKGKVVPDKGWIMEIAEECELMDIPLFMKESLRGIVGEDFRQEFPWEVRL